jgi:hypothetical protein
VGMVVGIGIGVGALGIGGGGAGAGGGGASRFLVGFLFWWIVRQAGGAVVGRTSGGAAGPSSPGAEGIGGPSANGPVAGRLSRILVSRGLAAQRWELTIPDRILHRVHTYS